MLPYKAGDITLTPASRQKLDHFFSTFCEGADGRRYGFGHLIFACHAAFPFLLTPGLANLIWLNFNTYLNEGSAEKADQVAVSDLLLSPLLRPVAGRQFEMIPEIRNYLLFLLKDQKWLKANELTGFGDDRLGELATFLGRYLADKRSQTDLAGFREMNEWAVLAYLKPERLAQKVAEAFRRTIDGKDGFADETAQLRLNGVMDKFGRQLDMQLHAGSQEGISAFVNLHRYTKGNRAMIFRESAATIDAAFYDLAGQFIDPKPSGQVVELPLLKRVGERLVRKKDKIQRVFPLLINISNYRDQSDEQVQTAFDRMDEVLAVLEGTGHFQIEPATRLNSWQINKKRIFDALTELIASALDEDVILIYYQEPSAIAFEPSAPYSGNFDDLLTETEPAEITAALTRVKGTKKCQLITLLNTVKPFNKEISLPGDIQLSLSAGPEQAGLAEKPFELDALLLTVIKRSQGVPTWRHLLLLLREEIARSYDPFLISPILHISPGQADDVWLTRYQKNQPPLSWLIVFSRETGSWRVLQEDFIITPQARNAQISEYATGKPLSGAQGEFYFRGDQMLFGGSSKELKTDLVYLAEPTAGRIGIYYPDGEIEHINAQLAFIFKDRLTLWSDIRVAVDIDLKTTEQIRISKTGSKFRLTYLTEKKSGTALSELYWEMAEPPDLKDFMTKFARYAYLFQAARPDKDLFAVECFYGWSRQFADSSRATPATWVIDDRALRFEKTGIRVNDIYIRLISAESLDLYYDVYLLTNDLQIKKLTAGNLNLLPAEREIMISFSEQELIINLLRNQMRGSIKVLFSQYPIIEDLSQDKLIQNLITHG